MEIYDNSNRDIVAQKQCISFTGTKSPIEHPKYIEKSMVRSWLFFFVPKKFVTFCLGTHQNTKCDKNF